MYAVQPYRHLFIFTLRTKLVLEPKMSHEQETTQSSDNVSVEYEVGSEAVPDMHVELGNSNDFVEFEMETSAVFRRLADDIYESTSAGIREPVTNSISAILRNQSEYDGADDGVVEITLGESQSQPTLTIKDNGIGISRQELEQVLSVVGRSATRSDSSLPGQFGMGFLAAFKLVGTGGGFIMHTHSRNSEANPYSGVWTGSGFVFDTEDTLSGGFSESEYGTKFEFVLRDGITTEDIDEWVEEFCTWSRVPVIYKVLDDAGLELRNEDYGCIDFVDMYDESAPYVEFETEFFRAVSSPEAAKRTILLDVPIRRNRFSIHTAPWSVDIRFKYENSIVVDGPHKGLYTVEELEYRALSPEEKENYVSDSDLSEDDIVMPGPTGTRDSLAAEPAFWTWVGNKLYDEYEALVRELLTSLNSPDAVFELEDSARELLFDVLETSCQHSASNDEPLSVSELDSGLCNEYNQAPSKSVLEAICTLTIPVKRVNRPEPQPGGFTKEFAYEFADPESTVYMGCRISSPKREIVWEDSEENVVVKVPSADTYSNLKNAFGWRKLTEVSEANIDSFDVDEELKRKLSTAHAGSKSTSVTGEEVVIRRQRGSIEKATVEKLYEDFSSGREYRYISTSQGRVVLFTDSSDEAVSDYYDRADSSVAIARCSDEAAKKLTELDPFTTISEYKKNASELRFESSEGLWDIGRNTEATVMYHVVPDGYESLSNSNLDYGAIVTYLQKSLDEKQNTLHGTNLRPESRVVYVQLTQEEANQVQLVISDYIEVVGDKRTLPVKSFVDIPSDTALYAYERLGGDGKISEEPAEVQFLLQSPQQFSYESKRVVDMLARTQ